MAANKAPPAPSDSDLNGGRDSHELTAISSRCNSHISLEQAAEEGRIVVPDLKSDLVAAAASSFEEPLCFLNAQRVHVFHGQETGGRLETASESPWLELGVLGHCANRIGRHVIIGNPGLTTGDRRIALLDAPANSCKRQLPVLVSCQ
jgi:hypothetical protein